MEDKLKLISALKELEEEIEEEEVEEVEIEEDVEEEEEDVEEEEVIEEEEEETLTFLTMTLLPKKEPSLGSKELKKLFECEYLIYLYVLVIF